MKNIKNELRNILYTNEPLGKEGRLKKVQNFLRRNAETGTGTQKQQHFKSEEASALITFPVPKISFIQMIFLKANL